MSRVSGASIIVTSYNYGRYLKECVDSALNQTYASTEVIVVDDASTDNSREVIASYGSRITAVLKENGGQGSAFNAGFSLSKGDVVLFLDSDDALATTAVENVMPLFDEPDVVKIHWPLWLIDSNSRMTGKLKEPVLPEGDFRQVVRTKGPMTECTLPSAPTSGNAYARAFLKQVMPMPEKAYRISPDAYLFGLAPAFGRIKRLKEPQGFWRYHGKNASKGTTFNDRLSIGVIDYEQQCGVLKRMFRNSGIDIDIENWKANSWWLRIDRAIHEIQGLVTDGEPFILADGDGWGTDDYLAGRKRISFIEREGKYWGAPDDDQTAIRELERLRQSGVNHMVFAWPVFWWFDYYSEFINYVRSNFRCELENDRLVAFDLRR
jgi:glycosyltransferase involved in cell wall biosynthesis